MAALNELQLQTSNVKPFDHAAGVTQGKHQTSNLKRSSWIPGARFTRPGMTVIEVFT